MQDQVYFVLQSYLCQVLFRCHLSLVEGRDPTLDRAPVASLFVIVSLLRAMTVFTFSRSQH